MAVSPAFETSAHAGPEPQWRTLDFDLNFRTQVHRTLGFVRGIAQTPDGYLWFGTSFGVARYDGVRFDVFDRSNTPALQGDHIMGLIPAAEGGLWIATQRSGLVRYDQSRFRHVPLTPAHDAELCCLAQDDQNAVWVGTTTQGLYRYKDGEWQLHPEAGSSVTRIVAARDGHLLIQTHAGWVRVQQGSATIVPPEQYGGNQAEVADFLLNQILPLGPAALDDAVVEQTRRQPFLASHVTPTGVVWLAINGLTRIHKDTRRVFRVSDGVASENILSIFEDREGNVWSGHYGTGLTQMSRVPFLDFSIRKGFGGGAAFSLAQTSDDTIWISQSSGLTEVRGNQFRNWWPSQKHPLWGARSLTSDAEGALWMVLDRRGLARLAQEHLTVFPLPNQQDGEFATALTKSPDNALWVGTGDGALYRFNNGEFEEPRLPILGERGCALLITPENPCPQASYVIENRKAGGLWLGTAGRGLWQYTFDGQSQQVPGKLLAQATVFAVLEQDNDALWVGTAQGLFFVSAGKTVRLDRKSGLVSDGVFSILNDGAGNLWLGGDRGVYSVATQQLEAVVAGTASAVDPVSYRALDGLPGDEMIRRFAPTALKAKDGRLWFSAVAGVAIFPPPQHLPKPPLPVARLVRVVLKHNVFVPPFFDEAVQIPPGTGDLEFHYTAPAFSAPHRIKFEYKLEGFDSDWVRVDGRRVAYYTNIPAGSYRFRVKAQSPETRPLAAEASFSLILRPRFFETLWFYLMLAAGAVLVVVIVQRLRIRSVQTKFQAVLDERNRIARDLHDTLAQVFSAIGFQLDSAMGLAPSSTPVLKDRLKRVRLMLAHARLAARNVIWNLRQTEGQSSSVQSLVSKLEAIAPLYDSARIEVSVEGPTQPVPALIENELFHIAQEAVSNAVEHGKAGLISMELGFSDGRLEMLIHDNGVGFEPQTNPDEPRFGLRGMRERAQRIGAELKMHAEPEVGTEISVSVPIETPGPRRKPQD